MSEASEPIADGDLNAEEAFANVDEGDLAEADEMLSAVASVFGGMAAAFAGMAAAVATLRDDYGTSSRRARAFLAVAMRKARKPERQPAEPLPIAGRWSREDIERKLSREPVQPPAVFVPEPDPSGETRP